MKDSLHVSSLLRIIRDYADRTDDKINFGEEHLVFAKKSLVVDIDILLSYDGESFINNLFQIILHRDVDTAAMNYYINLLDSNLASKSDIIRQVSQSDEGVAVGVQVIGLYVTKISKIDKIIFKLKSYIK